MKSKPGLVVCCCDGIYQRYLIRRMAQEYRLLGVVLQVDHESRGSLWSRLTRYINPFELLQYLTARFDAYMNRQKQEKVLAELIFKDGKPPDLPTDCPIVTVSNINAPEAVALVQELSPDLICVNGTRLLRKPMLDLIPTLTYGIINLHTGLSPYARGGNCNLYALLEGRPQWVGVTIHHIDPGIDSGDIILTAQVEMTADDVFQVIDTRTFHTGVELMVEAIRQIVEGKAQRVKQWTEGELYLRRTGYVFKPYLLYKVNKLIKSGLLKEYLEDSINTKKSVRLINNSTL